MKHQQSLKLADWTWEELDGLERERAVVVLPVGATEAHGPHLPLCTDVVIAEAMARNGAEKLRARGHFALVAPPLAFTVADFASGFAGTVSIRPETAQALLEDVGTSLQQHGFRTLAVANAHLDPVHIRTVTLATETLRSKGVAVAYPDVTRKPWALRLSDEFKSGACHAGQYEGSIVMAERADLVRDDIRRGLEPNASSLSVAIRNGLSSFEEAGGPRAYFGDPAAATAAEGRETIDILGSMIEESVLALAAS